MFTTAAFIFLLYGGVEIIGCNGAITALIFGITLGNIKLVQIPLLKKKFSHASHGLNYKEKAFFSEIVFLLKTFFYVYIGISIQLTNYRWLIYGLIIMLILYILRGAIVRLTLSPETSRKEAALISVIMPKGLAAAAIASLPIFDQIAVGEMIQGVVYAVILFSTVLSALFVFVLKKTTLIEYYKLFFNNFKNKDKAKT
jgi:NhaP-type Na+/H+ or K+/H+ antiporter